MTTEPIHVLGAGSLGLLWAASIRTAFPSYPIQLLLRPHHQSKISDDNTVTVCIQQQLQDNKKGPPRIVHVPALCLNDNSTTTTTLDTATNTTMNASRRPIIRNLLVTTKAYQVSTALQSIDIQDRIHTESSTRIILLCNGALAVRDELLLSQQHHLLEKEENSKRSATASSRPRIHLAWTTHGAYRELSSSTGDDDDDDDDDMFHVVHAGMGQTAIEEYEEMANLWDRAGLNCHSVSSTQMERQLWYKLAANCVINPLTAIARCTNGELLNNNNISFDHEHAHDIMDKVLDEVARVAQQQQSVVKNNNNDITQASLQEFCLQVLQDTASNKSSMLQDVLAQRPTEIDYLNGYIVRQAQKLGVDGGCPVNERLRKQVKSLTKNNQR